MAPKILIAYYTTYGTNYAMAKEAQAAAEAKGAEVRLRKFPETAPQSVIDGQAAWKAMQDQTADVPEVSHDDMRWAEGYLLSVPTRYGNVPSQAQAFIDTLGGLWAEGALANKTFSAMTSAANNHAGQEMTLQGLYVMAAHWGDVIVPPGFTSDVVSKAGGNPYGASVTAGGDLSEEKKAAIRHQAERLVEFTERLTR